MPPLYLHSSLTTNSLHNDPSNMNGLKRPSGTSSVITAKKITNGRAMKRQSSAVQSAKTAAEAQVQVHIQAHVLLSSSSNSSSSISHSPGPPDKVAPTKFRRGISLTPRMFTLLQKARQVWESDRTKITASVVVLLGIPSMAYGAFFPTDSLCNHLIAVWTAWDGLLSIGSVLVVGITIPSSFIFVEYASSIPSLSATSSVKARDEEAFRFDAIEACCSSSNDEVVESPPSSSETVNVRELVEKARTYAFSSRTRLFHIAALAQLVLLLILLGLVGPNSLVFPSWLWHPFLWGSYHVYDVDDVPEAMDHVCYYSHKHDLCLDDDAWELLSAGALSRYSQEDLRGVHAGQAYAEHNSIVINVLARDIKDHIPALRINVESLVPLFKSVALVVFENDSSDGTRDEFKQWAKEAAEDKEYVVDLMECEGVVDCKLNLSHRDNVDDDYDYSSAIGEMHTYRNTAVQYILNDHKYQDFSHLLVLDVDLAVPFSPLGILHTLGLKPEHAVASSGRQPWPTAFGSLVTPYDLNAFRELNTGKTMGLEAWHRRFCGIAPLGERWRSECDALSPTHLIAILWNDRKLIDGEFYAVNSAFNGAVLYPIKLLKESEAMYNKGEDGQRCEHVGFHKAINNYKTMLVNRKWDMHLMPENPGGPNRERARKTTNRITFTPRLMMTVFLTHLFTVGIFVWATFTLGVFCIQPAVSGFLRLISKGQPRRSMKGTNRSSSLEMDSSMESRTSRKVLVLSPSQIRRSNGLNRTSSTDLDAQAMSPSRRGSV